MSVDPVSLVLEEVRKRLSGFRMLGPAFAQGGIVAAYNNWGGRPTDTALKAARFFGLPTTWIDNFRGWLDALNESLTDVALAFSALLIVSLGHWLGGWLRESEAVDSQVRRSAGGMAKSDALNLDPPTGLVL